MPEFERTFNTDRTLSGALAIFVKTPGLSNIKTRLASKLGASQTAEFYELAVSAIQAVAVAADQSARALGGPGLVPYWAVAESEGLDAPRWSRFARIDQGTGGLGSRLHNVYRQLLKRHAFVLLIGADSPQMSVEVLRTSCEALSKSRPPDQTIFILGRTDDGGYYLFGGNRPLPRDVWESVDYSVETTAEEFARGLAPLGEIQELPISFDVDIIEDLRRLAELDDTCATLLPEQRRVITWAKSVFEA